MDFSAFFVVLLASVLFSVAFRSFHLPWVLALITAGIFIGPHGFALAPIDDTTTFISQIGLILLMFMAGLETKLSSFRAFGRGIAWLAFLNGIIPFIVGYLIGFLFGFPAQASLLLGVIFMSSSIAVIVPSLEANKLIKTELGRSIVSATIIVDIASLILLSIFIQSTNPITVLPLPSFYILLVVVLIGFRYGLPELRALIPRRAGEKDIFETEVRVIVAMLIGVVVTLDLLGLHPIIASFFAGLVLSESIKSEVLIEKLRTISYGLFIPMFFVTIGMQTDIRVFLTGGFATFLTLALVVGSMGSKLLSGWLGGSILGFDNRDATIIGVATIPQLSTTLAVVFTAVELGLLQDSLIAGMVMLSIISTITAPLLLRKIVSASS